MSGRPKINTQQTSLRPSLYLILGFILSALFTQVIKAQEFTFEHSDCKIRTKTYQNDEFNNLIEKAKDKLVQRNFVLQTFIENERLLPNDLYFSLEVDRPKDHIFTSCIVKIAIKVAKGNKPTGADRTLYQKSIKRSVPRITLKGSERCRMALQDAFVHIPLCKSIGYNAEKK